MPKNGEHMFNKSGYMPVFFLCVCVWLFLNFPKRRRHAPQGYNACKIGDHFFEGSEAPQARPKDKEAFVNLGNVFFEASEALQARPQGRKVFVWVPGGSARHPERIHRLGPHEGLANS